MKTAEWSDLTRALVAVAMGRAAADLVVRRGSWVCVQSGEIVPNTDIAVKGQRIAYVGPDASHTIGPDTRVIEAEERYLVPGLLDGHMHVEMAMVTLTEFVRGVLPHGTTGIVVDPHELANVLGLTGVRLIADEAAVQPISVWVQMPSCVPSAPGLETSGATLGPAEVAEAMTWPAIIGLGEMMNFQGAYGGDHQVHAELAATRAAGRVIGGHYASPDLGLPFHGYVAAGPDDDHEGTRLADAVARARQGLKTMLRLGGGLDDLSAQVRAVTELGLDPRHFILATDGLNPGLLVQQGHMDRLVRHTIGQGVSPLTAIQMATLNTAEHFGVARDAGQIAPGRYADILLVDDLVEFSISTVIARGCEAARDGQLLLNLPVYHYAEDVRNTVRLARPLDASDFRLSVSGDGTRQVNVIGMIPNQIATRHIVLDVAVHNGQLATDPQRDLAKVAVIERHRGNGGIQLGFVQGFGLRGACAIGSTMTHDSHQMVILGTDEGSMATVANKLADLGGGQIVVHEGEVRAQVPLPIAGLMSEGSLASVAEQSEQLARAATQDCGCLFPSAITQITRLALAVIPELRISDLGLVDVTKGRLIPLMADQPSENHPV